MSENCYYVRCRKCGRNYARVDAGGICDGCARTARNVVKRAKAWTGKPRNRIQCYAAALPWTEGLNVWILDCKQGYRIRIKRVITGGYKWYIQLNGEALECARKDAATLYTAQVNALRKIKQLMNLKPHVKFRDIVRE